MATLDTDKASRGARLQLLRDLFEPKPLVYWADFGASAILGWSAFYFSLMVESSLARVALTVLSVVLLYRAVVFTHELAHLRSDTMRSFQAMWHVLCGIPFMVPSFFYRGVHNEHHVSDSYGTEKDGEYVPFGRLPRARTILFLLIQFVLPLYLIVRFALLGPLSWLFPPFRLWLWQRASSLSVDFDYRRAVPKHVPAHWIVQETLCSVWIWSVLALIAAGILPLPVIAQWYLVGALILFANAVRTLAAHRYLNDGNVLSADGQIADSVNIPGSVSALLLAPIGLRFHALHHMFPTIPYHNLGIAHRRLMQALPRESNYHNTVSPSIWRVLSELWRNSRPAPVCDELHTAKR